ncbi:MAG: sigma 54-interacting transcriptional regulator [Deferribacteraceae bacterium]|jgi:DNA-binding NtrC family response regulator|nr:sigma 54-interacting transcriptional regulator [Deferribacteraceae bacterium]
MLELAVSSKKMQKIDRLLDKASQTNTAVLIIGEKGVGKSAYAQRIHGFSPQKNLPFVLFKANRYDGDISGCIVKAGGSTLFIYEVAYMQLKDQVELMKFLISANHSNKFRLIASTSVPLEPLVKDGSFMEDLYFYLRVMQIRIPALRERKEDIPSLIDSMSEKISGEYGRNYRFDNESKKNISSKPWKGNIIELEKYIRFILDSAGTDTITAAELERIDAAAREMKTAESLSEKLYSIACEFLETAKQSSTYTVFEQYKKLVTPPVLRAALHIADNNKSMAAKLLGINRNTLKKNMRDYNIED